MMRWIIGWSMQLRLMVVAAAAVLMFFGFTQLRNMPVDVLPEFSRHYVEIQTEALGLSAAEVESMITVPLEADMLNGVSWVEEIRSESIPGLSSIVLFFEPGRTRSPCACRMIGSDITVNKPVFCKNRQIEEVKLAVPVGIAGQSLRA